MNEHVEKREATINPEILPEKLSVIIKDEDGNLYESTKDNLRQKGYIIKELDLKKFINSDADIQRQIEDIKTIRSEILENATMTLSAMNIAARVIFFGVMKLFFLVLTAFSMFFPLPRAGRLRAAR